VEVVDGDDKNRQKQRAVDARSIQIVHGRDEEYQVERRYIRTVVLVSNMISAAAIGRTDMKKRTGSHVRRQNMIATNSGSLGYEAL
jgi:hypothetical protein